MDRPARCLCQFIGKIFGFPNTGHHHQERVFGRLRSQSSGGQRAGRAPGSVDSRTLTGMQGADNIPETITGRDQRSKFSQALRRPKWHASHDAADCSAARADRKPETTFRPSSDGLA